MQLHRALWPELLREPLAGSFIVDELTEMVEETLQTVASERKNTFLIIHYSQVSQRAYMEAAVCGKLPRRADFISRLIALVPKPRINLIRFHSADESDLTSYAQRKQ